MPDRPTVESAQAVILLIQEMKIPESVLIQLRSKYGNGTTILSYWEEWLSDKAQSAIDLVRTCYSTKGEIKPTYAHLKQQLYRGLCWCDGFQIKDPILFSRSRLTCSLLRGQLSQFVSISRESFDERNSVYLLLRRCFMNEQQMTASCFSGDSTRADASATNPIQNNGRLNVNPHGRMLRLDQFIAEFLPQFVSTNDGGGPIGLIRDFDPWSPARCILKPDFAPLLAMPTATEAMDQIALLLKKSQRDVLESLMQWMAVLADSGDEGEARMTELSHLIELITVFGNFVWGVEMYDHVIIPIVIVQQSGSSPSITVRPSKFAMLCD